MADKQTGTGSRGKQNRPKEQGGNEYGNHTRTSTDNRSRQVKENNRSTEKVDHTTRRS